MDLDWRFLRSLRQRAEVRRKARAIDRIAVPVELAGTLDGQANRFGRRRTVRAARRRIQQRQSLCRQGHGEHENDEQHEQHVDERCDRWRSAKALMTDSSRRLQQRVTLRRDGGARKSPGNYSKKKRRDFAAFFMQRSCAVTAIRARAEIRSWSCRHSWHRP
jgi:hypothetical protein